MSVDVSGRIEELMAQRNWTVYRLCKESGLAQSTLSHIFHKDSEPTFATLDAICKAFGITLAEFFSDRNFVPLTEDQRDLLDKWATLTSEQKQLVLQMISNMK
jgi:transcriptional regulator with XRE-family HTH domain